MFHLQLADFNTDYSMGSSKSSEGGKCEFDEDARAHVSGTFPR
jgi:hypothetical protein